MERLEPFDRLCEGCAACFNEFDGESDYHTTSWPHSMSALTETAARGCHICSLLLDQILHSPDPQWQPFSELGAPEDTDKLSLRITFRTFTKDEFEIELLDGPCEVIGGLCGIWERVFISLDVPITRSIAPWNYTRGTLLQIRRWIDQCVNRHKRCMQTPSMAATRRLLPTRLLDISSSVDYHCVRLVSTSSMRLDTQYVTLSHCWGGSCAATLLTANVQAYRDGISVSSLPRTFHDAVIVTAELGIHYLWIDALCIVQDSRVEWEHESSLMGDIYANSYLTIAATASKNSDGGLFYQRSPLAVQPCRAHVTRPQAGPVDVLIFLPESTIENHLHDRAWAMQESLLSKRVVHFSRDQVRWSCPCLKASECRPEGNRGGIVHDDPYLDLKRFLSSLSSKRERQGRAERWACIRELYSSKKLTKPGDKLRAFSGIARRAHRLLDSRPEDYCAGLWRPNLPSELLWIRDAQGLPKARRSTNYVAPTWSWASLDCAFRMGLSTSRTGTEQWLIDVVESKTEPVRDVFGAVSGGRLVLRSSLYTATNLIPAEDTSLLLWPLVTRDFTHVHIHLTDQIFQQMDLDCLIHKGFGVYFMPVIKYSRSYMMGFAVSGLLVQPSGNSRGQYYRVGVLTIEDMWDEEDLSTQLPAEALRGKEVREDLYVEYQGENCGIIEVV